MGGRRHCCSADAVRGAPSDWGRRRTRRRCVWANTFGGGKTNPAGSGSKSVQPPSMMTVNGVAGLSFCPHRLGALSHGGSCRVRSRMNAFSGDGVDNGLGGTGNRRLRCRRRGRTFGRRSLADRYRRGLEERHQARRRPPCALPQAAAGLCVRIWRGGRPSGVHEPGYYQSMLTRSRSSGARHLAQCGLLQPSHFKPLTRNALAGIPETLPTQLTCFFPRAARTTQPRSLFHHRPPGSETGRSTPCQAHMRRSEGRLYTPVSIAAFVPIESLWAMTASSTMAATVQSTPPTCLRGSHIGESHSPLFCIDRPPSLFSPYYVSHGLPRSLPPPQLFRRNASRTV